MAVGLSMACGALNVPPSAILTVYYSWYSYYGSIMFVWALSSSDNFWDFVTAVIVLDIACGCIYAL